MPSPKPSPLDAILKGISALDALGVITLDTDARKLADIAKKQEARAQSEFEEKQSRNYEFDEMEWDGTLSYSGIKRLVFGLWHDGKNEKEENMTEYMPYQARQMYKQLINEYSNTPEPIIKF